MGYEPLVNQNPLRVLKLGTESSKQMGLVMARAGVGKTALLVQIALESILRGKRVIHVSIGESIEKTRTWYDDILQFILQEYSVTRPHELIDLVKQHRMILTFKESAFSRPKLEERLKDLVQQDIFRPDCLVVDGFDFESSDRPALIDIKELMEKMNILSWFSAVIHREDQRVSGAGIPAPCHEIDDLFENVILLKPEKNNIQLDIVKSSGGLENVAGSLMLDPTTMMIRQG
jgi:KaiC/GvpD/RAD55 family RecA-like ATPase